MSTKQKKKISTKLDPQGAMARSKKLLEKSGKVRGARKGKGKDKLKRQEPEFLELGLRPFQLRALQDETSGVLILHWARQIGKSHVLAAWAVHRLMRRPGRLVTLLSNSRENGAEFLTKCAEFARLMGRECETADESSGTGYEAMKMEVRIFDKGKVGRIKVLAANPRTARGFAGDLILDEFAFHEDSAAIWEAAEPILASNPDFLCRIASTGNGRHNLFYRMVVEGADGKGGKGESEMGSAPASGAADGALAIGSETDESTRAGNGCALEVRREGAPNCARGGRAPQGLDATKSDAAGCSDVAAAGDSRGPGEGDGVRPSSGAAMCEGQGACESSGRSEGLEVAAPGDGRTPNEFYTSAAGFKVSRVPRSWAYKQGARIFDPVTRKEITPDAARALALDKRAYDQNYECAFEGDHLTLLSHELISAAEEEGVGEICEQAWSSSALANLREANAPLYAGFDVARRVDLSVITVVEKISTMFFVRAILRMRNVSLPEQKSRLRELCELPQFKRAAIDMTGLGLGLVEFAAEEFGSWRIQGVNFASSVPATSASQREGARRDSVRVTEALALELLQAYEDRRIRQPVDGVLRDDLRKPERMTTPGGRVSIAATRDAAGHADHFWSLALALEAAATSGANDGRVAMQTFKVRSDFWLRGRVVL